METSFTSDLTVPRPATNSAGSQLKQQSDGQASAEQQAVFKEEKMIAELARQQASANESTAGSPVQRQKAVTSISASNQSSSPSTKPSHTLDRAPNWSQLSAQVNGYTVTQRAMNLYQQIDRL